MKNTGNFNSFIWGCICILIWFMGRGFFFWGSSLCYLVFSYRAWNCDLVDSIQLLKLINLKYYLRDVVYIPKLIVT